MAAVSTDAEDMTWVLAGMLLMGFIYAMLGICVHLEVPYSRESPSERFAHALANQWAVPRFEALPEMLPALHSPMLGQTPDLPLRVPLGPLEARGWLHHTFAWSVDVLSNSNHVLFNASLSEAVENEPRVMTVAGRGPKGHHGVPDHVFATIDASLEIRIATGALFGTLVKEPSGEYVLEEAVTKRRRWALTIKEEPEFAMLVTWRPKGRLLATATLDVKRHSEFLKVMNSPGVDMVLVLTCLLGVIAFRLAPQEKRKSVLDSVEDRAMGLAAGLLSRLHI